MAQHSMVVSDVTCDIVHYIFKVAFEYEFGALSFVRIFFCFFYQLLICVAANFGPLPMRLQHLPDINYYNWLYSIFDPRAIGNLKTRLGP